MPDLQSDIPKDNIYECEAKRLVMRDGVKVREWRLTPVADVIADELDEYRCKDCKGRMKLMSKHVEHGAAPHAVHVSRQDSEYCPSGFYFRQNPGREPRLSQNPSNDIRFSSSKAKRKIPHPLLTR
jgi:hypothetical protein